MTAVYRHFGNLVYQYRVGALDREMWKSYENTLEQHLRVPSWRTWFEENKTIFSSSLVQQVERTCQRIQEEQAVDAGPGRGVLRA